MELAHHVKIMKELPLMEQDVEFLSVRITKLSLLKDYAKIAHHL
jgi:hypothetical protein